MDNPLFTVVDVETTGFGKNDRVIEVAAITMDAQGNFLRTYETLINPERDLGPTHIHQITAAMVKNAPKFYEIIGDLIDILAGTFIVGHNVSFDYRFLESEFRRAGIPFPQIPNICTLHLAKKVDPSIPSRKLGLLCDHFEIPLENSHCAYADCEATARLFHIFMREYGLNNILQMIPTPLVQPSWPSVAKSHLQFRRSHFANLPQENTYIAELIARLPLNGGASSKGKIEYINLLDDVLADRRITSVEANLLSNIAMDYDISQDQAVALHQQFLSDLIQIALLDGMISNAEMNDLCQVANLLNISECDLHELIAQASTAASTMKSPGKKSKLVGKTVCFTGALLSTYNGMPITREVAQRLAREHGLLIKHGVTKGLDYLVAADPDSMSGKAKKAREYNIRVVAEHAFWSMLGIQVS